MIYRDWIPGALMGLAIVAVFAFAPGYVAMADTSAKSQSSTRASLEISVRDWFVGADTDHDGILTRSEFIAALPMMMGMNDRRGRSSWQDARTAASVAAARFDRIDRKYVGKLTVDEILARPLARFDATDANHDRLMSADEREAARAELRVRWEGPPPASDTTPSY